MTLFKFTTLCMTLFIYDSIQIYFILYIYDSIQNKILMTAGESRLSGYFCSETVFNLSNRVLSNAEIRIFEKGVGICSHSKENQ